MLGSMITVSRAHPRHVITRNTVRYLTREGDKKGVKIKDNGDNIDLCESDPEQTGEDEIHDDHQEDHWVGDEDEQQGNDGRARRQSVDNYIQEDNNVSENGQAPGGRPQDY